MAIKISGCNVIDDNRCLVNIACIDTNTKTAIENAGVGGEPYLKYRACSTFASGDPVTTICPGQARAIVADPGACCIPCCVPHNCVEVGEFTQVVGFSCAAAQGCVAVVIFRGGACTGSSCGSLSCCSTICVATTKISEAGRICQLTCLCSICLCIPVDGGDISSTPGGCGRITLLELPAVACSCSGIKSTVLFDMCKVSTACCCHVYFLKELHLCYNTSTCQIGVICNCDGQLLCYNVNRCCCTRFATPDNNYWVTVVNSTDYCPCSTYHFSIRVQCMTDSTCYLCTTDASVVCGCALKSFLPTSAQACRVGFFNLITDPLGYMCGYWPGMDIYSYGLDRWILSWHNVARNCLGFPCASCECSGNQRIFAWRPVGENSIETTCNAICPSCLNSLPYYGGANALPFNGGCLVCEGGNCFYSFWGRVWDQGDCIKRYAHGLRRGDNSSFQCRCIGYDLFCFRICAGNLLCNVGSNVTTTRCCYYCNDLLFFNSNYADLCSFAAFRFVPMHAPTMLLYKQSTPVCQALNCMVYLSTSPCTSLIKGERGASIIMDNIWQHQNFSCSWGAGDPCNVPNAQLWNLCITASNCPFIVCNEFGRSGVSPVTVLCTTYAYTTGRCSCCLFCPSIMAYSPVILNGGSQVVSSGHQMTCPIGCAPDWVQVYNSTEFTNNTTKFLGIAQNDANPGEIVCVAVPNMIDKSCFAERFFPDSCICYCCFLTLGACNTQTEAYFGSCPNGTFTNYSGKCFLVHRFYDSDRGGLISSLHLS